MFPSSNSINPSFHFSPSIFLHSPPFLPQHEINNISLPQMNHEVFPNPNKRTKRKDRHSKIYTAHGLRDRRVRLSVDIARRFFLLQDILGFDKASQTICWLFKKAESSIKELDQKQCLNLDGFVNISLISELSGWELGGKSLRNTILKSKDQKINTQSMPSFYGLRRESRARARARARERTREKIMCAQKIDELNHPISNQSNILVSRIETSEGMVGEVMQGSPSSPKSDNPLTTHKGWDKNNFAEFEVFSKYFEACNQ